MNKANDGIINLFARHRVAANLLMLIMLLAGIWALINLNTQFLPKFKLNFVTVSVVWPGATAEDVERSIVNPIEQRLQNLDDVKEMKSLSREGLAILFVEFIPSADMRHALDQIEEFVAQIRNLPQDSEKPIIKRVVNYEPIAKLIVTGPGEIAELRPYVHQYEKELLKLGIARVETFGLPEEEIAIQIPMAKLAELHLSLDQIAAVILQRSQDVSAGDVGQSQMSRQIRSLQQRRTEAGFDQLPIISDETGRLIRLGDIAIIEKRAKEGEVQVESQGKPAVEMRLQRSENASALSSAKIINDWVAQILPTLSLGMKIQVVDQRWQYIEQRINLLIKNGVGGLVLILIILFFFLHRKVAMWVAMGIPVSLMAAFAVLYAFGGSINMVTLFATIMSLGIIVDDTIVVGEEALTQLEKGKDAYSAVTIAAHKMLFPIMASSLTTIAAFIPLMLVGGIIGDILFRIPFVVICVIMASLVECFFVLPGHLHHDYKSKPLEKRKGMGGKIDIAFDKFKNGKFRKFVTYATQHPWLSLCIGLGLFILSLGIVLGGRLNFNFFPSPDFASLNANVQFIAGTSTEKTSRFLRHVEQALYKTDEELRNGGKPIVLYSTLVKNKLAVERAERGGEFGEEFGHIFVELTEPDQRSITNQEFIRKWRSNITISPDIDSITITSPRAGPPGRDLDIQLSGRDATTLKLAAVDLMRVLHTYPGVSEIQDNLPWGQEQYIFDLTPQGQSLGLTIESIGKQIRAAFEGQIVQIFHEADDEIEVRVMLPDKERFNIQSLEQIPILTKGRERVPLDTVVKLRVERGINVLRHVDTRLTTRVTAVVDAGVTNNNNVLAKLKEKTIPGLMSKYGLDISYRGRAQEQEETLDDMKLGLMFALVLIYIILAWVFASYGLPLVVMIAIPFGLTGAIFGHLIMGIDLTILSLFGFFGLAGIVINDSIILVTRYLRLCSDGMLASEALVEASCQRLRAVMLTSLTTIAGLTPLLFETSTQAQFLIPMAVSISFGLAYATLLVLVLVPSLLALLTRYKFTHPEYKLSSKNL